MSAIRLARGVTGRSKIVKFAGCYHGHSDALLAAAGSGVAEGVLGTEAAPDSAGVTPGAVADTVVLPYNVVPDARRRHGRGRASSRWPPTWAWCRRRRVPRRAAGRVRPRRRAAAVRRGHHRLPPRHRGSHRAGRASPPTCGASARSSAAACPSARSVGPPTIMSHLAPLGAVYQAGTLSGNPLATAAGLAVLGELDAGAYDALTGPRPRAWPTGSSRCSTTPASRRCVPRVGPLVGLFFGPDRPDGLRDRPRHRSRSVATRRSSTGCSTGASRWRPGRTR